MRPSGDLMERLAAADPLAGAEDLGPGEQSEADALFTQLIATPAERGAPRARVRRWALVAAGALCSIAAAFAAVNLLDSDTSGPGVVEKAVAAVTRGGSVYHVVERTHARPAGFRSLGPMTFYYEYWNTTGGRLHRKTFAADGPRRGKLIADMAGKRRPGRRGGPVLMWDAGSDTIILGGFAVGRGTAGAPALDPYADPGAQLRALEQQGRLRLAGTTRVGDRPAYRLVSGTVLGTTKGEEVSTEFLVDSETYLPLAQHRSIRHSSGKGFEFSTRYLVYERLPLNSRTREELDLDPHPSATCSPSGKLKLGPLGFPNPCAR
jgi:hypothetical protein